MSARAHAHGTERPAKVPARRTLAASLVVSLVSAALCLSPPSAAQRAGQVPAARVAEAVAAARRGPLPAETFAQALTLGDALLNESRFAEAAELFTALAGARPRGEFHALYGAALATFNAGRAAEAETLARRAVETAPPAPAADVQVPAGVRRAGTSDALVLLAVVLAVRGDQSGSLTAARRAAALAPGSFDAQFTLGRALYGGGDPSGAARAFQAAAALRPEDPRPRFFLATALERAGDLEAALAAYRELVALHPRAAEGHLGLGVLLVKRGGAGVEEGIAELRRAVELNPDSYEARVTLGRSLVARGLAAESVEHLRRAAALAPDNPEPHYQLSLAYRRLGRRAEAAEESAIVKRIHEARRAAGRPAEGARPPED